MRWLLGSALRLAARGRMLSLAATNRLRIKWTQQKFEAAGSFPGPTQPARPVRLLAVVTHFAPRHQLAPGQLALRQERLFRTLRSLSCSFAHTELTLVLNSQEGSSLADDLPGWLTGRLTEVTAPVTDPLQLGFRAQDIFAEAQDRHDWFLYSEDDVIYHDACMLDKLALFNAHTGDGQRLLLPNRFEHFEGKKRYVDLRWNEGFKEVSWNRVSAFSCAGVRFAQCANPHSAMHCLSQNQLKRWLASGRRLRGLPIAASALESAATGCLGEVFELFKPAPPNLHFLEVEHCDQRYSRVLSAHEAGQELALPPPSLPDA